jgi:hypothetical protein
VQPHVAVGQHVFFDDVGQVVRGDLAFAGQAVEAPRQQLDHQRDRREQQRDDQHQLPVEEQQVGHQGRQREDVARQLHDRVDHHRRAVEHLVDHGVGDGAGGLVREQRQARAQQLAEHRPAQGLQALVGDLGQRVLRDEAGRRAR